MAEKFLYLHGARGLGLLLQRSSHMNAIMTASAGVAREINLPKFRTSTSSHLETTQRKTFFVTSLNRHAAFFAVVFYPHFENYCLSFAQMCNGNPATANKGTIKAYHADVTPSFATVSVNKSACTSKQPLVNMAINHCILFVKWLILPLTI